MVELQAVSKQFSGREILGGFSLTIADGEIVCLLGPSGCGKTTLLRVASGLLAPDSGSISSTAARAAFVFQEDRLLPWFDALENLTALGISPQMATEALQALQLGDALHTTPPDMSGGMRRRLSIARALCFGADTFFLDEPLRSLDDATSATVLSAMRKSLGGKSGLLITHSIEEALALGSRLLLVDGPPLRVVQTATPSSFHNMEDAKQWLDQNTHRFKTLASSNA